MQRHVVVIAGPSGSGKNAILQALLSRFKNCTRLVTATTRAPREGENEGVDYYFLSPEKFKEKMANGLIPEHRFVEALGTYYGTYLPDLDKKLASGRVILAQIDVEGAEGATMFKEKYGAVSIFILPGSAEEFEHRVRARNPNMSEDELRKRMHIAEIEMNEYARKYDYQIVNADGHLEKAVDDVVAILKKEGYTLES